MSGARDVSDLTLSVIVPAYNEESTLERVVQQLRAVPLRLEVIAVHDASTERTIHLLFAVVLGFLMYPSHRGAIRGRAAAIDAVLAVVAIFPFGYFLWKHQALSEWVNFVSPFSQTDFLVTVLAPSSFLRSPADLLECLWLPSGPSSCSTASSGRGCPGS